MSINLKSIKNGQPGRFFLGIDPGVTTGIAVWNADTEILQASSGDFWDAILHIKALSSVPSIEMTVVVEDPAQNSPVWHGAKSRPAQNKIAERVGANKREATLLIEYCKKHNINCIPVRPYSAKWDAQTLKAITGYKKRTNEHVRDAIKLVFGRK